MTRRNPPTAIESPRTGPAALLVAALLSLASAGPVSADRLLEIRPGVELTFPTQRGNAYLLEVSTNLDQWIPAGPLCFGDGTPVQELFPAISKSGNRQFFRLRILEAGSIGLAPLSLTGTSLVFNEGFRQRRLDLMAGDIAREVTPDETRTCSFEILKCAPNHLRLELWDDFAGHQVITLSFQTPEVGTYSWERRHSRQIADIDTGSFTVAPTRKLAELSSPDPPSSLEGLSATFDVGTPRTMVFSEVARLEIVRDAARIPAAYSYYREIGNKAMLRISTGSDNEEIFELEFLNRWGGSFTMRQFHDGAVEDVERGSFSLSGGPFQLDTHDGGSTGDPGHSGESPEPTQLLPASLAGLALDILVKENTRRLCFATASTGHAIWLHAGSLEYCPFTYLYEKLPDNRARLTVSYPGDSGDEVEVYEMSFTGEAGGDILHRDLDEGVEGEGEAGVFTTLRDGCNGTQGVDWTAPQGGGNGSGGYRHDDEDDEEEDEGEEHEEDEEEEEEAEGDE